MPIQGLATNHNEQFDSFAVDAKGARPDPTCPAGQVRLMMFESNIRWTDGLQLDYSQLIAVVDQ